MRRPPRPAQRATSANRVGPVDVVRGIFLGLFVVGPSAAIGAVVLAITQHF